MPRRKRRGQQASPKSANTIVVASPESTHSRVERSRATAIARFEAQFFEGPLPPPETLAKYEEACPGSASRIIAMAETQATHRQGLEGMVIRSNCRAQDRGPILGFILGVFVIGFGGYLILQGKEISGLVALLGALASIVVPFIYGKREQRRDLEEKREQLLRPPQDDWEYTSPPAKPRASDENGLVPATKDSQR